jgi:hypothetical protein
LPSSRYSSSEETMIRCCFGSQICHFLHMSSKYQKGRCSYEHGTDKVCFQNESCLYFGKYMTLCFACFAALDSRGGYFIRTAQNFPPWAPCFPSCAHRQEKCFSAIYWHKQTFIFTRHYTIWFSSLIRLHCSDVFGIHINVVIVCHK